LVALMISRFGRMSASDVRERLQETADPIACPTAAVLAVYAFFPSVNNDAPQACTGEADNNSWYGHGQVNALRAIGGGDEGGDNHQN
jgi:hypothetical protein